LATAVGVLGLRALLLTAGFVASRAWLVATHVLAAIALAGLAGAALLLLLILAAVHVAAALLATLLAALLAAAIALLLLLVTLLITILLLGHAGTPR
jgi:hypothetical protein